MRLHDDEQRLRDEVGEREYSEAALESIAERLKIAQPRRRGIIRRQLRRQLRRQKVQAKQQRPQKRKAKADNAPVYGLSGPTMGDQSGRPVDHADSAGDVQPAD